MNLTSNKGNSRLTAKAKILIFRRNGTLSAVSEIFF